MLSESGIKEIDEIRQRYLKPEASLLPALYVAQREHGWLSPEALETVAHTLHIPRARVRGVASFYAMYNKRPVGRHMIQICTNVACLILGAERLVDMISERYNLEPGGTSPDGRFSLVIMECIGACGTAPAMLVDTDFHENLTEENIFRILDSYT